MPSVVFADNSYGTLGVGIATTDSAITFTSGHGARFPVVVSTGSATAPLFACLVNSSNILEEIKISVHGTASDTATIVRAQGGTTAKSWAAGDRIETRASSTSLNAIAKETVSVKDPAFGALGDGTTDDTAAIIAAVATGRNVFFPKGVYGYTGGITVSTDGQKLIGEGTTRVATNPTDGTVLKRLSGTTAGITVSLYTEGVEICHICFDQNSLGGNAIVTGMHKGYIHDIVVHNQGGTSYGIVLTGTNVSVLERILFSGTCYGGVIADKSGAGTSYGAYYTTINNVRCAQATSAGGVGDLSQYGMNITFSSNLTINDFYVQGGSGVSLSSSLEDITFNGIRGELDGTYSLMVADGTSGGIIGLNVSSGRITQTTHSAGTSGFFDLTTVTGFHLDNFRFSDSISAVNRPYVKINGLLGSSFRNLITTNSSGNAHYLLSCSGTRSDQIVMENAYTTTADVGGVAQVTCDMKTSDLDYRNTNIPLTFNAASQRTNVRKPTATINTANATNGFIVEASQSTITDAAFAASRLGYGGVVSAMPAKIASAAAIGLTYIDPTSQEYTVSGTVSITSITAATSIPGRTVTLHFEDVLTFTDGNNLKLAGNFVTSADDTITLSCAEDGNWYEVARSAN